MSYKIEIIDNALTVTDTQSGLIVIDQPAKDTWYETTLLEFDKVKFYGTTSTNEDNLNKYYYPVNNSEFEGFDLAECIDINDVVFTQATFRTFCHVSLGKSSGGSAPGTTEVKGWLYPYVDGEWEAGTMTRIGDWTTIANTKTSDYPVPVTVGNDIEVYEGTLTSQSVSAKQLIIGQRYSSSNPFYLKSYTLDTVIGNNYDIYSVVDPLGAKIITPLQSFTADQSGTILFNVSPVLVEANVSFDLVVSIREPNPTPTTTLANYNYIKPNNQDIPLIGQVVHSTKEVGIIGISKTDNDTIDRTALLDNLDLGDVITLGDLSWSVQAKIDQGTYYDISVAPQLQASESGVVEFAFETVVATPISYGDDVDYFLNTPNVKGFISIDDTYDNATVNDNAYSMNLIIQDVEFSDEWDVVSSIGNGSLSGSGVNLAAFQEKAFFTVESNNTLNVPAYPSRDFITGLNTIGTSIDMTLDPATSSIVNTSGRVLEMTGTVAFQAVRGAGGGNTDFWFISESSTDGGVTWVKNESSLRETLFSRDGVDYKSGFSFTQSPWQPNQQIRFSFSRSGRAVSLTQVSVDFEGDTVESHSFVWSMSEH